MNNNNTAICVSVKELVGPYNETVLLQDLEVLIKAADEVIEEEHEEEKKAILYSLNAFKNSIENKDAFIFLSGAISIHTSISLIKSNKQEFDFSKELEIRLDRYEEHVYEYLTELVSKLES